MLNIWLCRRAGMGIIITPLVPLGAHLPLPTLHSSLTSTHRHTRTRHTRSRTTRKHMHVRWISAQPWLPGRSSKRLLSERIKSPPFSSACWFSSWPRLPPLGFSIFYSGFLWCLLLHMATSDGLDGCLQRGRSQSDPNILTEPGIDLSHGTGRMNVASWWLFSSFLVYSDICFYVVGLGYLFIYFNDGKMLLCPLGCQNSQDN